MQCDPQSHYPVRETIVKQGFSVKRHSALIAACVFLAVASGDQGGNDRVLILFGAQHSDIFVYFDSCVRNRNSIPWVKARKRNYALIKSHVQ